MLISVAYASFQDLNKVKVKTGEDVTLECHGAKDAIITLLEWSRSDLNPEDYVFFYRDERVYENYQHPSFMDRVELRDPEMKNGDVSVTLQNVSINDTGRYECYVSVSRTGRRKRDTSGISKTIELVVEDSAHTEGHREEGGERSRNSRIHVGVAAGLSVVVVAVVSGILLKRHMKSNSLLSSSC
ncbi:coxsackievirus and adenovirus receptor homolog [Lates japonicus]|uniref:Coxsackievirus and adenovirus receptor homolog n=1 Tax=Lates japonicus TaxID=270547 RepID=A0AAD3NFY3_LATJO|nr:coxsackievirus and adenovirus receptor homolog [Lates japonicus]